MTNSVDIIANSISLIQPDGSLLSLTVGGTIAPVNDPVFTGTVQGVTKGQLGLGNVDNTSDLNKPVSIATQSALNTVIANTNTTLTSHISLINGHTSGITSLNASVTNINSQINSLNTSVTNNTSGVTSLNTSVSNINSTLTSQLGLINTANNNISLLTTSTNNTFASQLLLINNHTTNISSLNTSVSNINSTLTSHLG